MRLVALHDYVVLAAAVGLARIAAGEAPVNGDPQDIGAPDVALLALAQCRTNGGSPPSVMELHFAALPPDYSFFEMDAGRRKHGRDRVLREARLNLVLFDVPGMTPEERDALERVRKAIQA